MRCDSLNSTNRRKSRGKVEELFPPKQLGHKSNRMVLNEAAQRLGVSLRQTEDQLMRDMLQSTASFINCTNGTNGDNPTEITRPDIDTVIRTLRGNNAYSFLSGIEGDLKFGTAPRQNGRFKSSLMDLKILPDNAGDNKAQAIERCAA